MFIILKCRVGDIAIVEKPINGSIERVIKCIEGFHLCPKPENQKQFDTNCFTVEEKIKG